MAKKTYLAEAFKAVEKGKKFESSLDNVNNAINIVKGITDPSNKDGADIKAALQTAVNDGDFKRLDKDVVIAIKVLQHVAGIGNLTADDKHAREVNGWKDSKKETVSKELLANLFDKKSIDEVGDLKALSDYAKDIINKQELQPSTTAKKEPEPEAKPAEDPAPEPAPAEDKQDTPPEDAAAKEDTTPEDTTATADNSKSLEPNEVVKELNKNFDEKYKEILSKIDTYPAEKQKAVKAELEKQRGKFTKKIATILKQETPYSGSYGQTTKMRAASAIKIGKNDAEYITKSLENSVGIKGSKGEVALTLASMKKGATDLASKVKEKANQIKNSYGMQKAVGTASEVIDKTKSAIKQTTDKVVGKMMTAADDKHVADTTKVLGKDVGATYKDLLAKSRNKSITAEEKAQLDKINADFKAATAKQEAPKQAPVPPVSPQVAAMKARLDTAKLQQANASKPPLMPGAQALPAPAPAPQAAAPATPAAAPAPSATPPVPPAPEPNATQANVKSNASARIAALQKRASERPLTPKEKDELRILKKYENEEISTENYIVEMMKLKTRR